MTEVWILKTADGEEYNFQVVPNDDDPFTYDTVYNLMDGVVGHHGTPITITSDAVPGISGAELRDEQRTTRVVYLPLFIRGKTPAEFHYYLSKLRKSVIQMTDHQLWVTNEEGQTRVLYCRYQKGFETAADDEKSALTWKFVGLYVEAMDPFFYDPPGSEINRNFSPDPWSEDFLTFSVNSAITADTAVGDTRIKIQNTTNFIEGNAIDIFGTKIITSDELAYSEEFIREMDKRAEDIRLGAIPASPANVVCTIATDNANPQVGQTFQISGTFTTDAGAPVTGQAVLLYATGGIKSRWNVSSYTGDGKYSFTIIPDAEGAYTFQVRLLADEINYHTAWTDVLSVNTGIAGLSTDTTLTLQASPATPLPATPFTLSGTLLAGTTGLANQTITIYKKSPLGKVAAASAVTDKNGNYALTGIEPAGWVSYEADFAGFTSTTYAANAITTAIESISTSTITQIINQSQSVGDITGSGNTINFAPQVAINSIGQTIIDRINGKTTVTLYKPSSASLNINIGNLNYPINYWAALPPSMIDDGEIQYFGYHSYNGIICIAESSADDYATELGLIENTDGTGNGLNAAIDISVVTDNVKDGSGNTYPLSHWAAWLASLYTAGWRLFCGINSTGRSGDPAYIAALGSGAKYINFSSTPRTGTSDNPDTYGGSVDHNSFQLFNSAAVPYIQAWALAAYLAAPSVKSGIMAGIWADDGHGLNQILINEKGGSCPDYRCLLDWSYMNEIGMTNFVAWFHPKYNAVTARDLEAEQVSLYESLGFPAILSDLRTSYAAITTPAWHEPTKKAVRLTYTYTDIPMIFSGTLTKLTSGAAIESGTITLQESFSAKVAATETTFLSASSASKTITVATGTGSWFIANQAVTISDGTHSETNTITSVAANSVTVTNYPAHTYVNGMVTATNYPSGQEIIQLESVAGVEAADTVSLPSETKVVASVDTDSDRLTFTVNLTESYSVGAVVTLVGGSGVDAGWADRGSDATNGLGAYVIQYLGAAGEHQFRVKFAEQTISGTDYMQMIVPTPDGFPAYKQIRIYTEAIQETNQIKTVLNGTILELENPIVNNYLVANSCYVSEYDLEDSFLTPDPSLPRTLNDNCNIVIFWMRGCPPCYTAKQQLKDMQALYPNLQLTFVEIQDHVGQLDETSVMNVGMDAAKLLYPEAYAFAETCGPAPPAPYGVIDAITPCPTCGGSGKTDTTCPTCDGTGTVDGGTCPTCDGTGTLVVTCPTCQGGCEQTGMMPAIIAIYRGGLFVQAFCGVHTTGCDPVSTEVLADTCGPKMYWRISASSIGTQAIIVNNGEITTYPIWTVTGPGQTPAFINVTTGESFQLDHELVEGEAVIIDATDFAKTVSGTRQENYTANGYMKSTICPTCQGKGVIAASCANCGGLEVCPTCHGSGVISVWVPASTGTTLDPSGMYNLRFEIDEDNDDFWGFAPNANVIQIELGNTKYGSSIVNMQIIQRYDGI